MTCWGLIKKRRVFFPMCVRIDDEISLHIFQLSAREKYEKPVAFFFCN